MVFSGGRRADGKTYDTCLAIISRDRM